MTTIRMSGLGATVLATLLAMGCDSGGSTLTPTTGTDTSTGTGTGTGGSGNNSATGGKSGVTTSSTGGTSGTAGGAGSVSVAANCGTATSATGSFTISTSNYFKVGNFAGYGFVYISPNGAPSITCTNSTFGSSTSALCGAGTVPADPDYKSVAGIGVNLNQASAGGVNSAKAISSPAKVSTVTVTFANTANTDLHIQIVQNAAGTDSGGTNYCYEAKGKTSPLTLNASDFTTTCWDAAPGTAWDGTGAQSFQFIIPSQAISPTPFDACIENIVLS